MTYNFTMDDGIWEIIHKCIDAEKAEQVVLWLAERCRQKDLPFTDYQWKSLVNHICAMVMRSKSGEVIDIDVSLFDEVAEDSLALSQEVVAAIGGLGEEEKYLLSIHFEGVKANKSI